MNLVELNKVLSKILQFTSAVDIDLDLRLPKVIKIQNLLKQVAIHLQIEPKVLAGEITTNTRVFFGRINDLIVNDMDEDTEEFGPLSKKILTLISEILKTDKGIENIQFIELLETLNNIGLKIEEKLGADFLGMPDTTPATIQEKLSTTGTESKVKKNSEKKA